MRWIRRGQYFLDRLQRYKEGKTPYGLLNDMIFCHRCHGEVMDQYLVTDDQHMPYHFDCVKEHHPELEARAEVIELKRRPL